MKPFKRLKPACFEGFPIAITNEGVVIPCCYCDDKSTLNDPEFQKLMAVSRLEDNDSIDQILAKKEWKRFYKNLRRNQGPDACKKTCGIKEEGKGVRQDMHIDTDANSSNIIRSIG